MKYKIKLTTLTRVHVGNGNFLTKDMDFVVNNRKVYIIDMKAIAREIGDKPSEFALWAENPNSFLRNFLRNHDISNYALRSLPLCGASFEPINGRVPTLKELIHDGRGIAYIPGSSIKGAIRTAILNCYLEEADLDVLNRINSSNAREIANITQNIEHRVLGGDPNHDIMRFLRVGDAYFGGRCEEVVLQINLNQRQNRNLSDRSKSQIVEVLSANSVAELNVQMGVTHGYKASAENRIFDEVTILEDAAELFDIGALFDTLNKYLQSKLRKELAAIERLRNNVQAADGQEYLDGIHQILGIIRSCSERQCVLRLGQGIGWEFTTGGWSRERRNVFNQYIVPASRPRNNNYEGYDFPKSRRIVSGNNPLLGFVKLELVEN